MKELPVRVDAEQCLDRNGIAVFQFTDTEEVFALHLRNGILVLLDAEPEKYDVKLVTTSDVWRDILSKQRSPVTCYATGEIVIEGGIMAFMAFMGCIERDKLIKPHT